MISAAVGEVYFYRRRTARLQASYYCLLVIEYSAASPFLFSRLASYRRHIYHAYFLFEMHAAA